MVGRTGHLHASCNAVTLVWGSLRLAPIIQLFEHPPFPGKMINDYIPSIQTRTPTYIAVGHSSQWALKTADLVDGHVVCL